MRQVRLIFKELVSVEGSDGLSVIVLTDPTEQRALNVICDKQMSDQLMMRTNHLPHVDMLLPETLMRVLAPEGGSDLELRVRSVYDGQYHVTLLNKGNLKLYPIRMSDAILLSYISDVPLYIDEALMNNQSSAYVPQQRKISIPINTIDLEQLQDELERAVAMEDYLLASNLKKEIDRRTADHNSLPQ